MPGGSPPDFAQAGYGPPGYPPPGYPNPQAAPLPPALARLPQSAPGTLFGIPLARLRDSALQRLVMLIGGVALLASIFVPIAVDPKVAFVWDAGDTFRMVVWPILAGAVYLFLTVAPPDLRRNIPPVVQQWLPFGVSLVSILIVKAGAAATVMIALISLQAKGGIHDGMSPGTMEAMASIADLAWVFALGYAVLTFGLLARLAQPNDTVARIVIGVGALLLLPMYIQTFKFAFVFEPSAFFGLHNVLFFAVMTVAVACVVFLIPPGKVPALAPVDALAPHVAAVLLLWLPLQVVLFFIAGVAAPRASFIEVLLLTVHLLLPIVAYFGVLMVSAPAAYDEAKNAILKSRGGGGPPPPGGGYGPPPGGGYGPPPGGGYGPPPGGGYPPPGGGYGPPGGGYPPPAGGSFAPPAGGGWPQQ